MNPRNTRYTNTNNIYGSLLGRRLKRFGYWGSIKNTHERILQPSSVCKHPTGCHALERPPVMCWRTPNQTPIATTRLVASKEFSLRPKRSHHLREEQSNGRSDSLNSALPLVFALMLQRRKEESAHAEDNVAGLATSIMTRFHQQRRTAISSLC